jgi:predicted transcriptional regulator
MIITDPKALRTSLAREKKWLTIVEIAAGLGLHRNTVRHMLKQKPVDPQTIRLVADAVQQDPTDIAEFVN